MPFTPEEIQQWHEEKRRRETKPEPSKRAPIATCLHCHQPFGIGEGIIVGDIALCDRCNGD